MKNREKLKKILTETELGFLDIIEFIEGKKLLVSKDDIKNEFYIDKKVIELHFRAYLGMSFKRYIQLRRISNVASYLDMHRTDKLFFLNEGKSQNIKLKEIAKHYNVDYTTIKKEFYKYLGISPRSYRNSEGEFRFLSVKPREIPLTQPLKNIESIKDISKVKELYFILFCIGNELGLLKIKDIDRFKNWYDIEWVLDYERITKCIIEMAIGNVKVKESMSGNKKMITANNDMINGCLVASILTKVQNDFFEFHDIKKNNSVFTLATILTGNLVSELFYNRSFCETENVTFFIPNNFEEKDDIQVSKYYELFTDNKILDSYFVFSRSKLSHK